MKNEVWKDIKGYEGSYQVSNLGQVCSLDRIVYSDKRTPQRFKGRILKQGNQKSKRSTAKGYKFVFLGAGNIAMLHRVVADAFVPNPEPELYDVVDHRDSDTHNNCADNLRWTTNLINRMRSLRNPITLISPSGDAVTILDVIGFARENNLNASMLRKLYRGECKCGHYKGWTQAKEIDNQQPST